MKQLEKNSKRSFILTIISFALIIISIILLVISKSTKLPGFIIGLPILLAGLSSIGGLIYGLKTGSERNSIRKIISLIFNAIIFLCFIAFMLGDLMKA